MARVRSPGKCAIGLLGGAFNPAHAGHVHISLEALRHLKLDKVWWLVAADHPTKAKQVIAPFNERVAQAQKLVAPCPAIEVSTLERELGTRYTYDTLVALQERFPDIRFIWLIGADNLADFSRWHRWEEIFQMVPIAVFNRKPYMRAALESKAAVKYARYRIGGSAVKDFAWRKPPVWCFLRIKPNPLSSTAVRIGKRK